MSISYLSSAYLLPEISLEIKRTPQQVDLKAEGYHDNLLTRVTRNLVRWLQLSDPPAHPLYRIWRYSPTISRCVQLCTIRKASCRWQTRATLAKRLHGLCKSSECRVVSCIASLPIDSLPVVSYYRPTVTLCLKCTVFEIWRHIGRKSPKKPPHSHLGRSFGVTPCEFFDDSYLVRN